MDIGADLVEFVDENLLVDAMQYKDHVNDWHCAYMMAGHLLETSDATVVDADAVRKIANECYPSADAWFRGHLMQLSNETETRNKQVETPFYLILNRIRFFQKYVSYLYELL